MDYRVVQIEKYLTTKCSILENMGYKMLQQYIKGVGHILKAVYFGSFSLKLKEKICRLYF